MILPIINANIEYEVNELDRLYKTFYIPFLFRVRPLYPFDDQTRFSDPFQTFSLGGELSIRIVACQYPIGVRHYLLFCSFYCIR